MKKPKVKNDTLHRKYGGANPELYARCSFTWAGLGDLKEDSAAIVEDKRTGASRLKLSRFLVHTTETRHSKPPVGREVATFSSWFSIASWVNQTKDSEGRAYNDRRFILTYKIKSSQEERRAEFRVTNELYIGRNSILSTILTAQDGEFAMSQTRGVTEYEAEFFDSRLREAPHTDIVSAVKAAKREALSESHTMSRNFHDYPVHGLSTNSLGVSSRHGVSIGTEVEQAIRMSDRANNMRLPEISLGSGLHEQYMSMGIAIASSAMLGASLS